ncbi:MAG TPA: radical SAM protein, partial [Candidatus Nanoarchaeia archaeon]|nr:radical SAM protein [Candidatus Nanoarchaeia archaeon]
ENKYETFENHILLPIRKIEKESYDGFVYNLGIEGDHTYTVNNIAVHNCFNHAMVKNYGPDSGKWVRFRSVERVIAEVKSVMKKYGGKMVYFQDDTFIVNRPWIQKFTEMYRKEINIPYHCHIRANLVDEKMAKMLKDSNCYSVHMAIEAGNDYIRNKILKREMSREEIFKAANLLNKYGIKTMLQNMVGLPTGTVQDDLETLKINIKCKPTYAWCSIFQPYPGVELTEFAGKQGLLKGDYNDISAKFFNDTVLKMSPQQKKEIEHLHKWFAVAANHPMLYHTGILRLLMKVPEHRLVKKAYAWVYQKYRENRDNDLYGIPIWNKKNKIKMIK